MLVDRQLLGASMPPPPAPAHKWGGLVPPPSWPTEPRGPGPHGAHPPCVWGHPPKTGLCLEGSGAKGKIVFPFLVFFKLFWNS